MESSSDKNLNKSKNVTTREKLHKTNLTLEKNKQRKALRKKNGCEHRSAIDPKIATKNLYAKKGK